MGWLDERDWYNDRIFEAYITKEEIDKQRHRCAELPDTICAGDKISLDGFKEGMPWLIKYGAIHYKHSNINFGEPLAWKIEGDRIKLKIGVHSNHKGLFPVFDEIWQEIKSFHNDPTKKSFMSIGGQTPLSPHTKCDNKKCWDEIYKLGVFEVSWVGENPANLGAEVDRVNLMAKSGELTIEDVLIDLLAKGDDELLQKPFGPWADWDECMAEMRKRYDEETAAKVCGRLKARLEKIREINSMGEEEEKKGVDKQGEPGGEPGGEAGAAPPEVNPLEAIMGRLDALETRISAIEETAAPPAEGAGAGEGEEKGNEPKTAPGELKVSFKSELKEVMDESLPGLVKGAVKEYFEEAKLLAKGLQKPVQKEGGQDSGSTVLEKAMEEADKATSAKGFFA